MIHYPERFSQAMPAGFDGIFDWDFLRGAFGPKIMPMDFDGVIERYGHFLVFETKANDSVPIPLGQKLTLESALRTNIFTVFVVYGKTPQTITGLTIWVGRKEKIIKPANADTVYEHSARWFQYACENPWPSIKYDVSEKIDLLKQENVALRSQLKQAERKIALLRQVANRTRRRNDQSSQLVLFPYSSSESA